ncbi:MAG: YihA family ribosome biogenesis GTP-binding protein [Betaproteobacteria bacterium]|nr:YihA family ribosome biogenesis GTP-binding protein [Betaproteobacteria bacterium]
MTDFSQTQFLTSAVGPAGFPPADRPEIAFAGRSNVGKSSAINALANRKRLAFASKTPGRTQAINFFDLGPAARLVDLPGYGYAEVPQATRAEWDALVGGYLGNRPCLAVVVVLMDVRHPLKDHDLHLFEWLRPVGAKLLVLLTKADKLSRSAALSARTTVLAALRARAIHAEVMVFSAAKKLGVEETRGLLQDWLEQAAGNKRPPV